MTNNNLVRDLEWIVKNSVGMIINIVHLESENMRILIMKAENMEVLMLDMDYKRN